jgi:murein L,D-transpeptidase YcbB/YkuD
VLLPQLATAAAGPGDFESRIQAFAPRLLAPDFIRSLYVGRAFAPLWDDRRADALLGMIGEVESHGLDPRDYLFEELRARLPLARLDAADRADADILLSEAFLRLAYHLRFGKVDPSGLDANWNYSRRIESDDPTGLLTSIVESDDLASAMNAALGHGPIYDNLRRWLVRYRALEAAGGWPEVSPGTTLHPDDDDARVVELRRRLAAEAYALDELESTKFDAALARQVGAFQSRHGLDSDAIVGRKTLAALNVSAKARVDQLRINLERLRWVVRDREARFIAINIAGFQVYFIDGDEIAWSARAVVGRPYRQTPVFRATMTYLVFNPDWTVPPTILRNDTLPAIHKNPAYLEENHMDVVNATGRPIDPASIEWARYPAERFPYFIRQRPGEWNALGRVKFIFPNDHFVFLHDTPTKTLFEKSERTFSSGCIRVERPFELAEILLRGQAPWDAAEIQRQVATDETKTVFLRNPVPVLVVYLTALSVDGGESLFFYPDVYRRDAALLAALDAPPE